jgi:hypothetical protein
LVTNHLKTKEGKGMEYKEILEDAVEELQTLRGFLVDSYGNFKPDLEELKKYWFVTEKELLKN